MDEVTVQCGYHYGTPTLCRLVQLTHCPRSGQWQESMWVCVRCRYHLRGLFRYC